MQEQNIVVTMYKMVLAFIVYIFIAYAGTLWGFCFMLSPSCTGTKHGVPRC